MLKEINSGTIFAYIVTCAPFLGISFHNFEQVRNSLSLLESYFVFFLLKSVTELLSFEDALAWPFFLCHYGTCATERIRSIELTVYGANWLDYPLGLRKHIILVIAVSRSNISFNGFGIFGCILEIFAKVRVSLSFELALLLPIHGLFIVYSYRFLSWTDS